VGRDQLPSAPQAKLVVAAPGLFDHQVYRPVEVALGKVEERVQGAETQQSLRCLAADIRAVVVVRAEIFQAVAGDLVSPDAEHGGKEEDLLHPAEVHALEDALGALPSMPVRCVWESRILFRL
jgi:hypothetical protein